VRPPQCGVGPALLDSMLDATAKYSSAISLRSLAVPRSMQLRDSRWQRSA
jgi:hypothetical protein